MTRFLNISTDNTLGGLSPSDEFVASQKAIKEYVDNNSSNVQVDNLTITTNSSDEIQTVAAINQNSGILKFWKGSKTEYDNLPSHDPDTQYTVTGDNTAGMMPAGSIIPFAGTSIPDGYLLCDGSAISRTTYADLFAAIGTVYGDGDGSTTFNLPGFYTGASLIYGTPGIVENGGIPDITGAFSVGTNSQYRAHFNSVSGAFYTSGSGTTRDIDGGSSTQATLMNFQASRISSVYNTSTKVYASGLKMHFVIKYI